MHLAETAVISHYIAVSPTAISVEMHGQGSFAPVLALGQCVLLE
jgi:septum formation topological specificity factor MinE